MAGTTVALGFWLGGPVMPRPVLLLIVIATITATGFGNVVNDIKDIATDRISHPNRPLPKGEMTVQSAWIYACTLAMCALACAGAVSLLHLLATVVPLLMLVIYTQFLKGTPLAGNLTVSLLVAYALLFGGLKGPGFNCLLIPALLAFLLNLSREIIKDLEDRPGDVAAGITTTAVFQLSTIKVIVLSIALTYFLLLFTPVAFHQFGIIYAVVCAATVIPLQIGWMTLFAKKQPPLHRISVLIKIEMALGLLALAADRFFQ
jgi:geranylgeranylglycerol-phosphate geranylgeranyltransferase